MIKMLKLPRWHEVLLAIYKVKERNRYCERLNRNLNGSLNHLREIIKLLERKNLIQVIPTRKIKRIILTDKGTKIAIALTTVKTELT